MAGAVLLYYSYVDLQYQRADVAEWMQQLCTSLDLKGRIRVARDGVNVTIGGSRKSCERHIDAVKNHPLLCGHDIDFKLTASPGAANTACTKDAHFDGLWIRQVDELITLGPRAVGKASVQNGGAHLTPLQFHNMLTQGTQGNQPVLLDVRNVYETRIGKFHQEGVQTLTPRMRCFSDLPAWLDAHTEDLAGRSVMMYCTGGVRCERASAYLREKGQKFDNVFQLKGGIVRYLEAFPDGGAFAGKNFVFDERVAEAAPQSVSRVPVGRCLLCGSPWDDYAARHRCSHCRMLVLVCDSCAASRQGRQATEQRAVLPGISDTPQYEQTRAHEPSGSDCGQVPFDKDFHSILCEMCGPGKDSTSMQKKTQKQLRHDSSKQSSRNYGNCGTLQRRATGCFAEEPLQTQEDASTSEANVQSVLTAAQPVSLVH